MATWAKSPQYQGMPHKQYMQTEEGKRAGQFFRQDAQRMRGRKQTPGQTGFQTGQAQPQQSPYAGSTTYQKNPAGDFAAYAPQQAPTQQATPAPQPQFGQPSFQFRASDSFGNTYSSPADLTAQQGAMAQAINEQRARQIASGRFGPIDPQAAYASGRNMVQQGWQNQFSQGAMPALAAQAFPPQYSQQPQAGRSPRFQPSRGMGSQASFNRVWV